MSYASISSEDLNIINKIVMMRQVPLTAVHHRLFKLKTRHKQHDLQHVVNELSVYEVQSVPSTRETEC